MKYLKSPLNYIGGKGKLLDQILPLFPKNIFTFYDLFCGGCNVAINVDAEIVICNDNLSYLVEFYKFLQNQDLENVLYNIEQTIIKYDLSITNVEGYNQLRQEYNKTKKPLDLFVLLCYSFNHQIRFNNNHEFNCSHGTNRSQYNDNIKKNLIDFVKRIKAPFFYFTCRDFADRIETILNSYDADDFVYCDPPYLITTGSYNDGKRGFKGWSETEELQLLDSLVKLDNSNVKFALSNVINHKGLTNVLLEKWITENKFNCHFLNADKLYSNSNYQSKDRNKKTVEVLITNY